MAALRWLLKNYKNLSFLFIVMGFINVWAYFQWLGRVDVFPYIIGNVAGSLAILMSSLIFFISISCLFVTPSTLCTFIGLKSTIKDKKKLSLREHIKVYYNEGCAAATALVTIITAISVLFINPKAGVIFFLSIPCLTGFITHVACNFFINNKKQNYLRNFIARLERKHHHEVEYNKALKRWFIWERFKASPVVINLFYCFFSLLIAFISLTPLYILTGSKIYLNRESLFVQYFVVVVLYLLLFMPPLLMMFKNKTGREPAVHPSLALAPAVLLIVFGIFSALLIQINQRGIELVGMSSWKTKVFAFNAERFPAYYFPEDKWGETRLWSDGNVRLVEGIDVFSSGEILLVCPASLKELRQKALENNGLIWKTDEDSKRKVNELSPFCLITKSDQVRSDAALKTLFDSLPR